MKTLLRFGVIPFITLLPFASQGIEVTATVVSIDNTNGTLELGDIKPNDASAQFIPNVVHVSPGDLAIGWEGETIKGDLIVSDGRAMLQSIRPVRKADELRMQEVHEYLRIDTKKRRKNKYRRVGDDGINFAMHDQSGNLVEFDDFKGKWIIMNFFFTRCMIKEMCPTQTARMVELQRLAKERGIEGLQQVGVSFDPNYDTPGILNTYANGYGADSTSYAFLTGPRDVMLDLLKQYAVIAMETKNIIDHSVVTMLFDKEGKIVYRKNGTKWEPEEFLDIIQGAQKTQKND
jgi:protein SCO1/2